VGAQNQAPLSLEYEREGQLIRALLTYVPGEKSNQKELTSANEFSKVLCTKHMLSIAHEADGQLWKAVELIERENSTPQRQMPHLAIGFIVSELLG
jgi:hypothetical protein